MALHSTGASTILLSSSKDCRATHMTFSMRALKSCGATRQMPDLVP